MHSSRAVSTLVAVVIIVMVSVALVSVYFLFISGYVSRSASTLSSTPPRLMVESYSLKGPTLTLYVANEGTENGTIKAVYMENTATGVVVRIPLGEIVIEPGQVVPVNISIPPDLSPGKYLVKLSGPSYVSALSQ